MVRASTCVVSSSREIWPVVRSTHQAPMRSSVVVGLSMQDRGINLCLRVESRLYRYGENRWPSSRRSVDCYEREADAACQFRTISEDFRATSGLPAPGLGSVTLGGDCFAANISEGKEEIA
jgi:hypothetical protein